MVNFVHPCLHPPPQDEDDALALEACEFWAAFCETPLDTGLLAPALPRLVPLLLRNMIYDEFDEEVSLHSISHEDVWTAIDSSCSATRRVLASAPDWCGLVASLLRQGVSCSGQPGKFLVLLQLAAARCACVAVLHQHAGGLSAEHHIGMAVQCGAQGDVHSRFCVLSGRGHRGSRGRHCVGSRS